MGWWHTFIQEMVYRPSRPNERYYYSILTPMMGGPTTSLALSVLSSIYHLRLCSKLFELLVVILNGTFGIVIQFIPSYFIVGSI
jgi:hypothetical protein